MCAVLLYNVLDAAHLGCRSTCRGTAVEPGPLNLLQEACQIGVCQVAVLVALSTLLLLWQLKIISRDVLPFMSLCRASGPVVHLPQIGACNQHATCRCSKPPCRHLQLLGKLPCSLQGHQASAVQVAGPGCTPPAGPGGKIQGGLAELQKEIAKL